MKIKLTTTGTVSPVTISDLGALSLVHPTVDENLEFPPGKVKNSIDLQTRLDAGELTAKDEFDYPINDISTAEREKLDKEWFRDLAGLSNKFLYSNYSMSAGVDGEPQHIFGYDACIVGVNIDIKMASAADDGTRLFEFYSRLKGVPRTTDTLLFSITGLFEFTNNGFYEDKNLNIAVPANTQIGVYVNTAGPEIAADDPRVTVYYKWK